MNEIKLLDEGYVKFVGSMGTDETVIEAARMSTQRGFEGWEDTRVCEFCKQEWPYGDDSPEPSSCHDVSPSEPGKHEWKKKAGDKHLLDYLYRNHHSTPTEMCELAIEVQAPIMVFREWHRSRTQSYNELSARYSMMPNLHYVPDASRIVKQSKTNKQGSADEALPELVTEALLDELEREQQDIYSTYERLINEGVAKEVARINTPVSRYSRMRAKANLRNWFHFLNLRMRPNAQYEIRVYAEAVASIIKSIWPRSYALFEEYDLYGVHMSRTEMEALRYAMNNDATSVFDSTINHTIQHAGLKGSAATEFRRKVEFGGKEIL